MGISALRPTVEAKMGHLPSLHSLAPRMWNDDLSLDKWAVPSRPLSSANDGAIKIDS